MSLKFFPVIFLLFVALIPASATDNPVLPLVSPMFGDNMVLQRGKPNAIWGWAKPGERIRVEIAGRKATAVAEADGRWQARIQPPATGGPYTIKITGAQQTITFHE